MYKDVDFSGNIDSVRASVRNPVINSVWTSVRASVFDSVSASVRDSVEEKSNV